MANAAYGKGTSEEWLTYQLAELAEFAGARQKLTNATLRQTAQLIASEYWYLNLAEFMLFCRRFKTGRYGRFYGAADPLAVTCALRQFLRERAEAFAARDRQEAEAKEQAILRDPRNMTRSEWEVIAAMQAEYAMNTRQQDAETGRRRNQAANPPPHQPSTRNPSTSAHAT